jgi:hypothetical protein
MGNKRFWLLVAGTMLGLLLVVGPLAAQPPTIVLRRYAFSNGGGQASSGSLQLLATLGQPAAGQVQSSSLVLRAGFLHGQPSEPTAVRLVLQSAEPAPILPGVLPLLLLGLALCSCLALMWRTVVRQRPAKGNRL